MSHALPNINNPAATGEGTHPSAPNDEAHNGAPSSQDGGDPAELPQQREAQPPPPSQPISMSDNSDAIALRAAMAILQIQRQQALRDMKTLEEQKNRALEDPEGFARAIIEGTIKSRSMEGIIPVADSSSASKESGNVTASDSDEEMHDSGEKAATITDTFGTIPSAQNVVRMPPVNWARYHIVGESLDKLHEEQRNRPSPGQPLRDEDLRPRERAPEHFIAAPYNPWVDKVGEKPGRTRSGAKKRG